MLFLLTERLSDSGRRLSALSVKPGMGKTGVLSETGCECGDTLIDVLAGICMVGIRGKGMVSTSSSVPFSSTVVVFMSGEDVVRYPM